MGARDTERGARRRGRRSGRRGAARRAKRRATRTEECVGRRRPPPARRTRGTKRRAEGAGAAAGGAKGRPQAHPTTSDKGAAEADKLGVGEERTASRRRAKRARGKHEAEKLYDEERNATRRARAEPRGIKRRAARIDTSEGGGTRRPAEPTEREGNAAPPSTNRPRSLFARRERSERRSVGKAERGADERGRSQLPNLLRYGRGGWQANFASYAAKFTPIILYGSNAVARRAISKSVLISAKSSHLSESSQHSSISVL